MISGRSEQRRKETESCKEDCKQGMCSIPKSSTNAREEETQREKGREIERGRDGESQRERG